MRKNSKTADIAIWGRVPPPIGGMTVHIRRLLPRLKAANMTVQMYSVSQITFEHPHVRQVSESLLTWYLGLLFGKCEQIHYVFSSHIMARLMAALLVLLRGAKVVIRVGNVSLFESVNSEDLFKRIVIRFVVRHVTAIVGVNHEICELASIMGAKKVVYSPGFIPEDLTDSILPVEVTEFLTTGIGPLLLASGEVRAKEDDFYGAYFLLDLVENMPHVRLVFYSYKFSKTNPHESDEQAILAHEIYRRGLQDRYLLVRSNLDLCPVMIHCDILVRPVLSDGDSNAIREALYYDLPVVASDCVDRPPGVITFPGRDLLALVKVISEILPNLEEHREYLRNLPKPDYVEAVLNLFNELLGRQSWIEK